MAIDWQLVELPLSGVDQFTDAPHVLPNQLRDAINVRFREPPKAGKRYGHTFLPALDLGNQPITVGTRLHANKRQTLLCSDRDLFVLGETAGRWADRGRLSEALLERRSVYHDQAFDRRNADLAYNQGHLLVAWPAGQGELTAVIIDTNSNSVVQTVEIPNAALNATTWVRCLAAGDYLYLFSDFDGVANSIKYRRVLTTDPQLIWSLTASITLSATPSGVPDIAWVSPFFAMIYKDTGVPSARIDLVSGLSHTTSATNVLAAATAISVAVEGVSGENIYVAWESSGQVRGAVLDAGTVATVVGSTLISESTDTAAPRIGIARVSATKRAYIWEKPDVVGAGYTFAQTRTNTFTSAGAVGVAGGFPLPDVTPFSKPFYRDGGIYVWVGFSKQDWPATYPGALPGLVDLSAEQATAYLAEVVDSGGNLMQHARWVGTAARGIAKGPRNPGFLAVVVEVDTDIFESAMTCNYKQRFSTENDQTITIARAGVYRARLDFADPARFEAASWSDSVFLAGSKPSAYDGFDVSEHGFAWYPARWIETQFLDPTSPFGKLGVGDYLWCLVYEWEDALGQLQRSTPSQLQRTTITPGNTAIEVDIREALWTTHGGAGFAWASLTKVRVVPYRTVLGGTRLYRASVLGYDASYSSTVLVGGHDESSAVGSTDADALLILNDVLYTDGDILDNAGTPPAGLVAYHGDRMWLGKTEEPEWLWFSQPFVQGESPRFNEALRVLIGDAVKAMSSMDDKLVVFTESKIFVITGDGCPATGGVDVGFQVSPVSSETGCIEPRSLVLMNDGLGFMGSKGYALLNRGLQVEWIGIPAKNYFDTYNEITSACVDSDGQNIIISAKRGVDDTTSVRHVYNLTTKQWMLDLITVGSIADAALIWNGEEEDYRYAFVLTQGQGYIEDRERWTDGSASTKVTWAIVTAWIKPSGNPVLQAWQFIKDAYLFGDFSTCWGFKVEVGYDYANAYTTTYSFDQTKLAGLEPDQVSIDFEFMDCEAFRLRITELFDPLVESYEYGGPNIRSICVDAGVAGRGGHRIPDQGRL